MGWNAGQSRAFYTTYHKNLENKSTTKKRNSESHSDIIEIQDVLIKSKSWVKLSKNQNTTPTVTPEEVDQEEKMVDNNQITFLPVYM